LLLFKRAGQLGPVFFVSKKFVQNPKKIATKQQKIVKVTEFRIFEATLDDNTGINRLTTH
jgi:hypothetical protein